MDGIDVSKQEFGRLVGIGLHYVDALLTFVSLRLLSRSLDVELSNSPLEESETRVFKIKTPIDRDIISHR
jgi:hypothetical protein